MISIIILTYNSLAEDVIATLKSIQKQSYTDYEIIISDDCSPINHLEKVEMFLQENNYEKYKIINNSINQGTVCNYLTALEAASGEYVKPVSPGDMLYDENTLLAIHDAIIKNNCEFGFGRMYSYKKGDVEGKKTLFCAPKDLDPYYTKNLNYLKRNIVLYGDFISGASMFANRNALIGELKKMVGVVKYCEDYMQVQLILDGTSFYFLDKPIMLYECSQGISTKKTTPNEKSKVRIDFENYIEYLKKHRTDRLVEKRYKLNCYSDIKNPVIRIVKKMCCSPGLYWFSNKYKNR